MSRSFKLRAPFERSPTQSTQSALRLYELPLGTGPWPGTTISFPLRRAELPAADSASLATRDFLLTTLYISVKTLTKAVSTFVDSRADVSIKNKFSFSANSFASSVGTARRLPKSVLLPTSMMTMFLSAWPRSSSNHLAI
uniref:Uncharacterized protein n=1 Tax=Solanum lycopersicum TaxID=4081 RepID=A0A3Q7EJ25_SOLLC